MNKDRIISGVVILGTPVVFFLGLFFTCGLGPMEDDLIQYFPYLAWLGESLRAGVFPLWNGLAYGGYPAVGDPQSGIFYPLNWISGVLRVGVAYPVLLVLHYWIAGFGMYRLGRQWDLGRLSATTGAVAWMFCGFMLGHRTHYTILAAAAWMSVIFFLWVKVQQSRRPQTYLVMAVLAQGMQILAGHVQEAVLSGVAVFLFLLVTSNRDRVKMVFLFGLSYILTLGLVAVQLAPVWLTFGDSVRSANSYRFVTENSFLPLAWPLVIAPASMGLRVPNFLYEYSYFGPWNHCELNCFTTLVALVLAVFAVRNVRKDVVHRRLVWFFLFLGIAAVFLALGRYNPAYKLIYYLPIFRPFRCPARIFLLFNFAVVVLAMIGMETLVNGATLARFRTFAIRFTIGLGVVFIGYLWGIFYLSGQEDLVLLLPKNLSYISKSILAAIHPSNPALFIPLIIGLILIVLCRFVSGRLIRRAFLGLITLEIATVAPFYDFHFDKMGRVDLNPPAARQLAAMVPKRTGFIWPVSQDPYVKPMETLEPFCNMLVGQPVVTGYGPLLNKFQRRLFGWELWPTTGRFLEILTRQDMLNRFGIQYLVADPQMAARIDSIKEYRAGILDGYKEFITAGVVVDPKNLFSRSVRLRPGLYKVHFRARRNSTDEFRVFVSVSGLANPLWSGQQLSLTTWDIDKTPRVFEWYFFIPGGGDGAVQINFSADIGEGEFQNIQLTKVPFNLDHLILRPGNSGDGVKLYENTGFSGPAFFAGKIQRIEGEEPFAALRERAIEHLLFSDYRNETTLVGSETAKLPDRLGTGKILEGKEKINRQNFRVEVASRPALLVLPGGYDRGWRAAIDNTEAPVWCADGVSRAVLVPSGTHDIRLVYLPGALLTGGALTTFTGLILLTILTGGMVAKKR
jgi:hypothetical protein